MDHAGDRSPAVFVVMAGCPALAAWLPGWHRGHDADEAWAVVGKGGMGGISCHTSLPCFPLFRRGIATLRSGSDTHSAWKMTCPVSRAACCTSFTCEWGHAIIYGMKVQFDAESTGRKGKVEDSLMAKDREWTAGPRDESGAFHMPLSPPFSQGVLPDPGLASLMVTSYDMTLEARHDD